MSPRVGLHAGRGVVSPCAGVRLILSGIAFPCRLEFLVIAEVVRPDAAVDEIACMQRIGHPLRAVDSLVETERVVAFRCVGRQRLVRETDVVVILFCRGQLCPAGIFGDSGF